MIFEYNICGIPCKIRVNDYISVRGSFSRDAPSDLDYYGYEEVDYTVLDRKGYEAKWLARKINPIIDEQIIEAIREESYVEDDYEPDYDD